MKRLTILIDMDDTIENLCDVWVDYLNKRYDTHVLTEDLTNWDMSKNFSKLSQDQIYEPLSERRFWNLVKPLPGAVENILKLKQLGHNILIVTAASPDSVRLKLECVLFRYFPYIRYKNVIITSQKQLIMGDILIDDAPHNLEGGKYKKILFDAPHNRLYDHKKNDVIRVHNWSEIYRIISRGEI